MLILPVAKEIQFEDTFIFNSGGHFAQPSLKVLAIFVEGITRTISVIFCLKYGSAVQEEMSPNDILCRALVAFCSAQPNHCAILIEDTMKNISVVLY